MKKYALAIVLMLGVVAEQSSAITTTLEYEDQREAASRAAISNEITTAVGSIPEPDYSTSNATLRATIEAVAPAPGNYAAVSNAAMNAAITNAMQDAALAARPTRAEAEAGWWSAWTVSPVPDFVFAIVYNGGTWYLREISNPEYPEDYIPRDSVEGGEDATELYFSIAHYTATRHRVAAPVPTKPSDIGAQPAGNYLTQHQQLTPVYSQTPTYVGGTVNPPTYDGATVVCARVDEPGSPSDGRWSIFRTADSRVVENALAAPVPDSAIHDNTITWSGGDSFGNGVTATLVRTDIIGYTLGDQTTKPLQPQGSYAPATNIAKSALASDVQTSLGKADAAAGTNALSALPPFDFSTVAGMYLAISNLVHALGGSVTNFPAIPAQ